MEVMESSRVLVVDDEPQITRVLRTVLNSQGYDVRTAAEGESAMTNFRDWNPELVITDLYMPHMDGVELCRRIRALSPVPIIVLSVKGEEKTKVEALDSGADDYVTKPFGMGELLARLRTALRHGTQAEVGAPVFVSGKLSVDLAKRRVTLGDEEVKLSPKEYDLLRLFVRHAGRVLTHQMILKEIWGPAHVDDTQYLRVYVGQLRQKLHDDPTEPTLIRTEPGVGYRFAEAGAEEGAKKAD
jgi:two-component system KDP operon response regulator KdpE